MAFDHWAQARAEAAFFRAIGRFLGNLFWRWPRAAVRAILRWIAMRKLRWGALWFSFGRWLRLAVSRSHDRDGRIAEMASHQRFLSRSPLSPLRFFGWAAAVLIVAMGAALGWSWRVTIPELRQDLAEARAQTDLARADAQVAQRDRAAWQDQARLANEAVAAHEEQARREALETVALQARRQDRRARLQAEERRNHDDLEARRLAGRPLVDLDGRLRALAGTPAPAAVPDLPASTPGPDAAGGMSGAAG